MSKQKIFIVEDDPDDIDIMREAFNAVADDNYELQIVQRGDEAIRVLNALPDEQLPCLIVLDYNMPGLTGAEVLEVICHQERYIDIPKFILSTSASNHHIQRCLEAGASKYFVKPPMFDMYIPIIEEMLQACSTTK